MILYLLPTLSSCGIADESPLCDYYRNFTTVKDHVHIAQAGPGVYSSLGLLLLAVIFKLTITIFTFGIKVPAGLFIPSLCIGACVGRIVGVTMEQIAYNYPTWWFFQDSCSSSGESCMSPGKVVMFYNLVIKYQISLTLLCYFANRAIWCSVESTRCSWVWCSAAFLFCLLQHLAYCAVAAKLA